MDTLPTRGLHLAVAAFLGALLLHVDRVPGWCVAVALLAPAWRLLHAHAPARVPLPGRWLRVLLVLLLTVATLASHRTLNGLSAGSTLLLAMGAAKTLESSRRRDAQVLVFACLLLVLAAGLARQELWRLPLYAGGLWLCCAALAALAGAGGARHSWRTPFVQSGKALLWALPLAGVLFAFVPRLPGALWSLPASEQAITGLSDRMSPGSISELAISDVPAFRVRFDAAVPPPAARYWRGPVLHQFDGHTWTRGQAIGIRQPVAPQGEPLSYTVMLEPSQQNWWFGLDPLTQVQRRGVVTTWDGQLLSSRAVTAPTQYEAISYPGARATSPLPLTTRRIDTQLPEGRNPRSHALARQLRATAGDDTALLQALLDVFRDGFEYSLTPPLLLDHDAVDELLFNTRLGFCGHFASAFVFLARAAGIPARVVTGYLGGDWNAVGNYLIVRQSHAHAWAEAWLEGRGWVRIDPTAVVAPGRLERGLDELLPASRSAVQRLTRRSPWLRGLLARWDASNHWWQAHVVNFNQAMQRSLLERLGFPEADWRTLAWLLLAGSLLWAGIALAWYLNPRRRGAVPADPLARQWLAWRRWLGRRGIATSAHDPPLAIGERARTAWPEAADAIDRLVRTYTDQRFGTAAADPAALRARRREARRAIGRRPPLDDFADLAGLPLYRRLPPPLRAACARLAMRFLRRIHFEGCGGLELSGHMRRAIAFQACVPIIRRGPGLYAGLRAVLVYPDVFVVAQESEDEDGVVTMAEDVLSGQTEDTSRVLLSWKDVQEGFRDGHDYNVVLHEFAHVIDHTLAGRVSRRQGEGDAAWHDAFEVEYEALCAEVDAGKPTLVDPYGAEDPAEFFAVCTETFFGMPVALRAQHPRLYGALARLYDMDPADWPGAGGTG